MIKKTLLLLVALLSVCGSVNAQYYKPNHNANNVGGSCSLTISSQTKQLFWLFVDDVVMNENAVKSITVQGLAQGDHYIRVELDNSKHHTVGQFITINKASTTFCITQKNAFFGISAYNAPVYAEMTVNYGNQIAPRPPKEQMVEEMPMPQQEAAIVEMSQQDFEAAFEVVSKQSYDNTRLTVAKQIASSNSLSVNQIKRICNLFAFENNKLEFAKYAYDSCVDKKNYFKLNEVFKFDSDKQQLNAFINSNQ